MKKIYLPILFVLIITTSCQQSNKSESTSTETDTEVATNEVGTASSVSINLIFNGVKPDRTISNLAWTNGMVVDNAMDQAESKGLIEFTYSTSPGLGKFYKSIDSVYSDEGQSLFWFLCVNDTLSTVGASSRVLNANDVVKWTYTTWDEMDCIKLNNDETK